MRYIATSTLILVCLAGCATPRVALKNESTGQTVTCGGGMGGSLLGGKIGYEIEKGNDQKCVSQYEALGYKRLN